MAQFLEVHVFLIPAVLVLNPSLLRCVCMRHSMQTEQPRTWRSREESTVQIIFIHEHPGEIPGPRAICLLKSPGNFDDPEHFTEHSI